MTRPPSRYTLFPYTTLFRSLKRVTEVACVLAERFTVIAEDDPQRVLRAAARLETTHERRSEEHTSELQSPDHLVCRLLLEKKRSTKLQSASGSTARVTA